MCRSCIRKLSNNLISWGGGVVEARKEDLRRIQELEEQVQRLVDEMAMKEVIIASLAQQVQDLADQRLGMSIPELAQVQEDVQILAKTGEEWNHFLLDQFKGLVSIQREMQAHLQRLSAQVGLDARVGGDCRVASPPPPALTNEPSAQRVSKWAGEMLGSGPEARVQAPPPRFPCLAQQPVLPVEAAPPPLHSLRLGWMVVAQR